MTATKKAEMYERIERHGRNLLAIFPNATERDPVKLCKKLRALEKQAEGIALRQCNGPQYPDPETPHTQRGIILRKVENLLGNARGMEVCPAFINVDPRGYMLKITEEAAKTMDIHKDWGGYGIIAPDLSEEN